MSLKNLFKSHRGFSLPEVMMAMGLLAVVALGVTKMMETSNKAAKNIETKDEISQMAREISNILAGPNNCEETLRDKKTGDSVFFIKQVDRLTGQKITISRFTPVAPSTTNPKVVVESIKVISVSDNGTDGSHGTAKLQINFRKPQPGHLGGRLIKKEISLSANLCNKNYITATSSAGLASQCTGLGKKLIKAPTEWPAGSWYAVCQDCSVASQNKIHFCQSDGGGGVDVGEVSKITCINMGGTFDEATQTCDMGNESIQSACLALGGQFDQSVTPPQCLMGAGVASLQFKLCELEKKFLAETIAGGTTTLCNPNLFISGTGLANNNHTKSDCTGLGGTLMTDSSNKTFCKFNLDSCPAGWNQYNGWSNWLGATVQGNDATKLVCVANQYCYGIDCTLPAISFSENAPYQTCQVGDCYYDGCQRKYNYRTVGASRSQIGCY